MNASTAIHEIRNLRRDIEESIAGVRRHGQRVTARRAVSRLADIEHQLAGTEQEDFNACPVEGFDTILSYLSRTNPEAFDLIDQPVHGTISDGVFATKYAHTRGYPVLRVAAPPHMKRRFPKATHVNAYPTHMLVEIYG